MCRGTWPLGRGGGCSASLPAIRRLIVPPRWRQRLRGIFRFGTRYASARGAAVLPHAFSDGLREGRQHGAGGNWFWLLVGLCSLFIHALHILVGEQESSSLLFYFCFLRASLFLLRLDIRFKIQDSPMLPSTQWFLVASRRIRTKLSTGR